MYMYIYIYTFIHTYSRRLCKRIKIFVKNKNVFLIDKWCNTRFYQKSTHVEYSPKNFPFKIKMKNAFKIKKQSLRAVSQKTEVHTINNKIRKILEKRQQRSPIPPADIQLVVLLEMRTPPTGIHQPYLKLNNYCKGTPWMAASKCTVCNKS